MTPAAPPPPQAHRRLLIALGAVLGGIWGYLYGRVLLDGLGGIGEPVVFAAGAGLLSALVLLGEVRLPRLLASAAGMAAIGGGIGLVLPARSPTGDFLGDPALFFALSWLAVLPLPFLARGISGAHYPAQARVLRLVLWRALLVMALPITAQIGTALEPKIAMLAGALSGGLAAAIPPAAAAWNRPKLARIALHFIVPVLAVIAVELLFLALALTESGSTLPVLVWPAVAGMGLCALLASLASEEPEAETTLQAGADAGTSPWTADLATKAPSTGAGLTRLPQTDLTQTDLTEASRKAPARTGAPLTGTRLALLRFAAGGMTLAALWAGVLLWGDVRSNGLSLAALGMALPVGVGLVHLAGTLIAAFSGAVGVLQRSYLAGSGLAIVLGGLSLTPLLDATHLAVQARSALIAAQDPRMTGSHLAEMRSWGPQGAAAYRALATAQDDWTRSLMQEAGVVFAARPWHGIEAGPMRQEILDKGHFHPDSPATRDLVRRTFARMPDDMVQGYTETCTAQAACHFHTADLLPQTPGEVLLMEDRSFATPRFSAFVVRHETSASVAVFQRGPVTGPSDGSVTPIEGCAAQALRFGEGLVYPLENYLHAPEICRN